jgi:AraC-like DNA-binding protein
LRHLPRQGRGCPPSCCPGASGCYASWPTSELAQRLRTYPALLSKVINASCGQNFNDFVNTYHVQEAQRKLANPRFGHYSLVGVALESGFNSKSTFNRVFRKLLG